jgi:GNAT superfamily N-acetyltransferase
MITVHVCQNIYNNKPKNAFVAFSKNAHTRMLSSGHKNTVKDSPIPKGYTKNDIVGYANFWCNEQEKTYYSVFTFVHPKFRRQKVASQIYEFASKKLKGKIVPGDLTVQGEKFWKSRTT